MSKILANHPRLSKFVFGLFGAAGMIWLNKAFQGDELFQLIGVAKHNNVARTPQLPLYPAMGSTKASIMAIWLIRCCWNDLA